MWFTLSIPKITYFPLQTKAQTDIRDLTKIPERVVCVVTHNECSTSGCFFPTSVSNDVQSQGISSDFDALVDKNEERQVVFIKTRV